MARKKQSVVDQLAKVERVNDSLPTTAGEFYLYQIMVAAIGIRDELAAIRTHLEHSAKVETVVNLQSDLTEGRLADLLQSAEKVLGKAGE